ncbi:MAG: squalene--hopene cyclase [Pirellulales bacterium]|nr:squalene--hopene cyclase [Pirellulales bacterium]
MNAPFLERILHFLAGVGWVMGVVWVGLSAFTLGALILVYTRWGQSRPLEKCIGLSLLAHCLLVGYATTISLAEPAPPPDGPAFQVALVEDGSDHNASPASTAENAEKSDRPWEAPTRGGDPSEPEKLERQHTESPILEPNAHAAAPEPVMSAFDEPPPLDAPTELVAPPLDASMSEPHDSPVKSVSSKRPAEHPAPANAGTDIPEMYKLRVMPNRSGVARDHGGSPETEQAVQAALKWLAENQAADGRWKAGDHGAGRDESVLGHARQNAGSQADTGVSGLALLAFLASGNTHGQGEYQKSIRRGLELLLRIQARDGNLGGNASTYEFMYCHAMAACALSEAFGMTGDQRLREPVERAIRYSVAAQDARGGGWRYHPAEPGDTSQLGWQLMALKSAELAGIPMPDPTRRGITRFLQSVSSGKHGGLASYRAGERVSHSMTAEALVCWQFLGISREHPACNEAGDFLLTQLPGRGGKPNDYYWYYGTLAMYQLQGDYWQKWNAALQKTLLERQIKQGPLAGAWDTDTIWGGYGGRIYTTAIAALSLEVYYRFLPLYAE